MGHLERERRDCIQKRFLLLGKQQRQQIFRFPIETCTHEEKSIFEGQNQVARESEQREKHRDSIPSIHEHALS